MSTLKLVGLLVQKHALKDYNLAASALVELNGLSFLWITCTNYFVDCVKCSECTLFFITKLFCNLLLFNRNTQMILKQQQNWQFPVYRYTFILFFLPFFLCTCFCLIDTDASSTSQPSLMSNSVMMELPV